VWVERLEVSDLRNIQRAEVVLGSGLNVLVGSNAQGKTSLLEAVGLLARGRSFRTEQAAAAIRKGADALQARGTAVAAGRTSRLEVEVRSGTRRYRPGEHRIRIRNGQHHPSGATVERLRTEVAMLGGLVTQPELGTVN